MTKIIFSSNSDFQYGIPFGGYLLSQKKREALRRHSVSTFYVLWNTVTADLLLFSGHIYGAQESAAATDGWRYMAAALSTGLSCIGAGVAVQSAASAAIGALSEDSSIMGKALIFVALAESIALTDC